MTQQVYLRNGDLRMNEYTFKLLQWLKMRVYLYAAKTLHFTRVYNLKKSVICTHFYFIWKVFKDTRVTDQTNQH